MTKWFDKLFLFVLCVDGKMAIRVWFMHSPREDFTQRIQAKMHDCMVKRLLKDIIINFSTFT